MTYALLLHLSLYHNINKLNCFHRVTVCQCLVSVIPCADTLAVTTGEVSTSFLHIALQLIVLGVRCVETYSYIYIVKFVILACMVCIFCLLIIVLQCIARINLVEGLLLPFLYIHTCVIFNKCIQTLKKIDILYL